MNLDDPTRWREEQDIDRFYRRFRIFSALILGILTLDVLAQITFLLLAI